jgi:pimeloyl-ACP methyl ester carboxylesterase
MMTPLTLNRQRTLEQFLLAFDMKRLRGTSWRYYDIATTLEAAMDLLSGCGVSVPAPAPSEAGSAGNGDDDAKDESVLATSPPSSSSKKGAMFDQHRSSSSDVAASSSPSSADGEDGDGGEKEVVFVLPTCGVRAEAMFEHVIGLAGRGFRVIAPQVPETLNEFEDYAAGLLLIMRQEKIGRAHFFGLAMGGMIVQYLLSQWPERVLTATLAHVSPPDEEVYPKCEKALKTHHYAGDWLTHYLLGYKITARDLDDALPGIGGDEKTLWLVFMKRFQVSKTQAETFTSALLAFHRDHSYVADDFKRFKGDLFIIDAAAESPQKQASSDEMRELHPKAKLLEYDAYGPLYTLVRGNKAAKRVSEFIRESRAERKRKRASKQAKAKKSNK